MNSSITSTDVGRVDFHLHSYASNVTDYFAANSFSIPESYSDPIKLYRALKLRGMSLITLTDHNSIDGVRELLDRGLPDVFISSEMTTTFPEDGCNIHITVANMTEAQFSEVNRLRGNVYEMVAYVDTEIALEHLHPTSNKLVYFMTHPLMSTQNRPYGREGSLTARHIEKALLLCNCLEVQNGARTKVLNELTWEIVRGLNRDTIDRLANTHDIAPKGETPWLKSVVGGSDDHSGINPGTTWTEFALCQSTVTGNTLAESIRARTSRPAGAHGGPITIAHSILKLLYEGGAQRQAKPVAAGKSISVGGPMQSLLKLVFDSDSQSLTEKLSFQARLWVHRLRQMRSSANVSRPFETVLETQVYLMLDDAAFRSALSATATMDDRIFFVVKTLVNRIFAHYVANLRSAHSLNIVSAIKESVALVSSNLFVSLPYLVAFMQQSADCQIARDVRQAFKVDEPRRIALITDTFFEVNGVSNSIKRMIREAVRRNIDFTVVTCVSPEDYSLHLFDPVTRQYVESGRLKLFTSVANLGFPKYDGLQICFPPMLDMLKYLQEGGFTKIQLSTPGVIGIAGLISAKLLQIETAATYHTSIPEYVENYTKDVSLEAIAWKYMLFFYHSVDEMLVPSKFVAKLLHKRGLRNRKLLILDRWVDVDRFHPKRRSEDYWRKFDIGSNTVKFVYVGRVAVEKNLHIVAQAFAKLVSAGVGAHMIVIGDGPYRSALATQFAGLPTTFTGYLHGDELATALASCDVKVFPSTTDTWGNAPLEAQASGLPVIVTDIGGPAELMQHGVTGLMVRGNDVRSLHDAMLQLMSPTMRLQLGRAARAFAEANRVDEPFTAVLDSEAYRHQLHKRTRSEEKTGKRKAHERRPSDRVVSDEAANQPFGFLADSVFATGDRVG